MYYSLFQYSNPIEKLLLHQSPATGQGVFSELCTSFSCKAQLYCILWCSSQVSRCSNWLQPQMEIPYNKYCCQRLTITTLGMVCLREDWEIPQLNLNYMYLHTKLWWNLCWKMQVGSGPLIMSNWKTTLNVFKGTLLKVDLFLES